MLKWLNRALTTMLRWISKKWVVLGVNSAAGVMNSYFLLTSLLKRNTLSASMSFAAVCMSTLACWALYRAGVALDKSRESQHEAFLWYLRAEAVLQEIRNVKG